MNDDHELEAYQYRAEQEEAAHGRLLAWAMLWATIFWVGIIVLTLTP